MAKFEIHRRFDAWKSYFAVCDAADSDEALQMARDGKLDDTWQDGGCEQFDDHHDECRPLGPGYAHTVDAFEACTDFHEFTRHTIAAGLDLAQRQSWRRDDADTDGTHGDNFRIYDVRAKGQTVETLLVWAKGPQGFSLFKLACHRSPVQQARTLAERAADVIKRARTGFADVAKHLGTSEKE